VSDVTAGWLLRAYRRPLAAFMIFVVLPLGAAVLCTHEVNSAFGRQRALHNLSMTARLGALAVQETLEELVLFEQLTGSRPDVLAAVARRDAPALTKILREGLAFMPHVHAVRVTDPEGAVLAAVPEAASRASTDEERKAFWQDAGASLRVYLSPVHVSDDDPDEKIVELWWPLLDQGRRSGVVQLAFRIEAVRAWIQKIRVDPEGFLYVVDHRQQLVVYPFQVLPGRPKMVADWPPVAHPIAGESDAIVFAHQRTGDTWFAGIAPVGDTGWRVVAVQPEAALVRMMHRVLWPMALAAAFLLGLLLLVGLQWVRVQAFSLQLLQKNAKLLKQLQQRRTLGDDPEAPSSRGGGR